MSVLTGVGGQVSTDQTFDEFAWAVGLFEGEGSITFVQPNERRYFYIRLYLATTDEDVIRRFARIVGVGTVRGPIQGAGNRKPHWSWSVAGQRGANQLLYRMLPHLGSRRSARAREVMLRAGLAPTTDGQTELTLA